MNLKQVKWWSFLASTFMVAMTIAALSDGSMRKIVTFGFISVVCAVFSTQE